MVRLVPNNDVTTPGRCPARTQQHDKGLHPSQATGFVAARRSNASGIASSRVMAKVRIDAQHSTQSTSPSMPWSFGLTEGPSVSRMNAFALFNVATARSSIRGWETARQRGRTSANENQSGRIDYDDPNCRFILGFAVGTIFNPQVGYANESSFHAISPSS